jgi:hypothetical protein
MSDAEAPDSMGLEVLFDLSPDLMCLATVEEGGSCVSVGSQIACHLTIP